MPLCTVCLYNKLLFLGGEKTLLENLLIKNTVVLNNDTMLSLQILQCFFIAIFYTPSKENWRNGKANK